MDTGKSTGSFIDFHVAQKDFSKVSIFDILPLSAKTIISLEE